jgi:hypothetical protein
MCAVVLEVLYQIGIENYYVRTLDSHSMSIFRKLLSEGFASHRFKVLEVKDSTNVNIAISISK